MSDPTGRYPVREDRLIAGNWSGISSWIEQDRACAVCVSTKSGGQDATTLPGMTVTAFASGASDGGTQHGGSQVLPLTNPIFSFPGFPVDIRAIKMSTDNFETHIKQRHAFDVGAGDAGRFSRSILNRTTSMGFFSQEMAAMINGGGVHVTAYERVPGGIRLIVDVAGTIGTTPSGGPSSTLAIGLTPTGVPGVWAVDTAFPLGK